MLTFDPIEIHGFSNESDEVKSKILKLEEKLRGHFFIYVKMLNKLEELYPLTQGASRSPRWKWDSWDSPNEDSLN